LKRQVFVRITHVGLILEAPDLELLEAITKLD
jgi:hypothetical protein